MDYSFLGNGAPTTMLDAKSQFTQQNLQNAQARQVQAATQAAQQDPENKRLDMGISFLAPILNEPDPTKQAALTKTLVPMFNRYVPNFQLDPESTDVGTIRALAQSRVSPEKQAELAQQRQAAMGGFGGTPGTGIFPNQASGLSTLLSSPQPAGNAPPATNPAPAPLVSTDSGNANTAPIAPPKPGVDTNFLNQAKLVNPIAASMAENMIAGTFSPESGKGENDPVYIAALSIARRADPTFNAQSMIGRPAMVKNATSGKMYTDAVNLNSVAGHLYDLHEAAPLTGNDDHAPIANSVANALVSSFNTPTSKNLSQYRSILQRAAPELNKFYVGGEGDKEGRAASADPFADNLPVPTIQNNVKTQVGLLKSKADALQSQYNNTMGAAANKGILDPVAQALMADIDGKPLTPQQQQLVNAHRIESNLPPKTWQQGPQNAMQQAQSKMQQPAGTPIISSPNDPKFQSLPSGSRFMTSDGRIMVKH